MSRISYYIVDGYLLELKGNSASVDYWEDESGWQPLDVTAEFLQSLLIEARVPLYVTVRLGWREMGNQYSELGYFEVVEA